MIFPIKSNPKINLVADESGFLFNHLIVNLMKTKKEVIYIDNYY